MPKPPTKKAHELVRERLDGAAVARGRQLYLSSGVRELRIDVRRRRYSAVVDDGADGAPAATVKIETSKQGPSWVCSVDGRDAAHCPHVAALITAIREREAISGEDAAGPGPGGAKRGERVSLVEHLMGEASREHLAQAFRLCLKTYPELQGDLVFTILENVDHDGELYDEVVALMADPGASEQYTLPREGFDTYRLLDEINYLYEQERYRQCFLLSRAILVRSLTRVGRGTTLSEPEVDLIIASSGMLADLTIPPAPETLTDQVHSLGMRLLRRFPKLEPQIQSSLVALIDDGLLDQTDLEELEKSLRRRWERARKRGRGAEAVAEAERLAMPLALFYARTQQFDKLQSLFDKYLQNPLLRAPALAEMLHHNLQEVVLEYVLSALEEPPGTLERDDPEDMARCGMYNDLVMMVAEALEERESKEHLLLKAYRSIGHRIYGVLDSLREVAGAEAYRELLEEETRRLSPGADRGEYPAQTKLFVALAELDRFDEAFALISQQGAVDPVILLDYLPNFLPKYTDELFGPALESVVELLPLVAEEQLRELVRASIDRLWDMNEEAVREALDRHFVDIADDELADYVDVLLGDLETDDLGL